MSNVNPLFASPVIGPAVRNSKECSCGPAALPVDCASRNRDAPFGQPSTEVAGMGHNNCWRLPYKNMYLQSFRTE